jgi:hypothetical protein
MTTGINDKNELVREKVKFERLNGLLFFVLLIAHGFKP